MSRYESLSVATRTGAAKPSDFTKVIVDTTVQEKAVAFPTDAKLMHRARERLVRLAKKHGVSLRQSYARVGKLALVKQQRYAHAKQFKRARRSLKTLKTFLGRVIRDIVRKIRGDEALKNVFAHPLMLARRVRAQNKNLRRVKGAPEGTDLRVFSLHAPEVECIGKGKAHKPYEFGVKASLATTLKRSKGGQFIVHAKVIGHLKAEHRMGRNHLAHATGDAGNAILAAVGYNFRRLLAWLALLLTLIAAALASRNLRRSPSSRFKPQSSRATP